MTEAQLPDEGRSASPETFPTRRSLRETNAAQLRQARVVAPRTAFVARDAAPAFPAPSKAHKKPSIQRRVVALFAVFLVPGIFVTTSIPAWAFGSGDSDATTAVVSPGAQSVTTLADSTAVIARSSFDATTQEQLDAKKLAAKLKAQQAAAAASASSTASSSSSSGASDGDYSSVGGTRAAGDDYPWRSSYGLSPLGYVTRQCTDFVAWRLNRDAGVTSGNWKYVWSKMTPSGGNASEWAAAWKSHGWKTSATPVAGAVAWFHGNHVAYVKSVSGGKVSLEEYNWGGSRSYGTRTVSASSVALFLYPPPR